MFDYHGLSKFVRLLKEKRYSNELKYCIVASQFPNVLFDLKIETFHEASKKQ